MKVRSFVTTETMRSKSRYIFTGFWQEIKALRRLVEQVDTPHNVDTVR